VADQRRYRARFNELELRALKNLKQILVSDWVLARMERAKAVNLGQKSNLFLFWPGLFKPRSSGFGRKWWRLRFPSRRRFFWTVQYHEAVAVVSCIASVLHSAVQNRLPRYTVKPALFE